jgi:phosphate starvation-inducible PhoH-like protein
VDLPHHQLSGLEEASEVLDGVAGVAVCRLTSADVVRHPLVQRVVEAYARLDDQRLEQREEQGLTRPSSRIVRR